MPSCNGRTAVLQVNWSVLWWSYRKREFRQMVVLPLIVGIILVPIGLFTGEHAAHCTTVCSHCWERLASFCSNLLSMTMPMQHTGKAPSACNPADQCGMGGAAGLFQAAVRANLEG